MCAAPGTPTMWRMAKDTPQVWTGTVDGAHHRVEARGSVVRTITWTSTARSWRSAGRRTTARRRNLDTAQYVWPVVLAYLLARAEVRRRRRHAGERDQRSTKA